MINDRGAGWLFGFKVVDNFKLINDVKTIVRAHQLIAEGYMKHF